MLCVSGPFACEVKAPTTSASALHEGRVNRIAALAERPDEVAARAPAIIADMRRAMDEVPAAALP